MARTNTGLSLGNAFNDFFSPWNDWFGTLPASRALTVPAVNINESGKAFTLSVAAPGLRKDDFHVDVQGNILTISAEQESSSEEKDDNYSRQEYNFSSFSRSFTLPESVKADAIEAEYKHGVLELTLPKREEDQQRSTKVDVK